MLLAQVSLHPEPGVEGAGREGRPQVDAGEVQERLHQALVSTESIVHTLQSSQRRERGKMCISQNISSDKIN